MKERELREAADCAVCGNKVGASGLPMFWRVRFERLGVDVAKLRRQDGLGAFLGSSELARVMGPDEELTTTLLGPVEVSVCELCAASRSFSVYELTAREEVGS